MLGDVVKFGISEKVMEEICAIADACGILQVKLFGSRARGDYYPTSDIDLAVWGGNVSLFVLEIDEKTTTLLKYDVVDMNGYVREELRNSIHAEGVLIYEKI